MSNQYRRYLSAELLRCRGSALQWLPLLALPLVVMTVFFSAFASSAEDATGVLGWQSMFITGMYAPLIAVLLGFQSAARCSAAAAAPYGAGFILATSTRPGSSSSW